MTIELLRSFLGGCALVNYGILMLWFYVFYAWHDMLHGMHRRWFQLSRERFDAVHYAAMACYKLGIVMFNLVPYLVLSWLQ